jgi:hypothetical protein
MGDAYWKGGVDPELAPFSGYAHGMVAGTPVAANAAAPIQGPAPADGDPRTKSGVRRVEPPQGQAIPPTRAPFYSFRALFVPKVPSDPPPPLAARPTFGRRVRTALLVVLLPALAAVATYAWLLHRATPPSYLFVVNGSAQPVEIVIDGARRGTVERSASLRLDLTAGPHVVTAIGPQGALVDEATVQIAAPGARALFNVGGASLAVVTRGYGSSRADRVQPVPAGRVVALPPELAGDRVDAPFPATVTAPEGQDSVTLTHLCTFDAARRKVGCLER